jgi:hypothetical protein
MADLPEAKLRPQNRADQVTVLRAKARPVFVVGKAALWLGAIGLCLFVVVRWPPARRIDVPKLDTIPTLDTMKLRRDLERMEQNQRALKAIWDGHQLRTPARVPMRPATSSP